MKKKYTIFLFLFTLFFSAAVSGGEMRPVPKIRGGYPPYDVIGKIVAANQGAVEKKQLPQERAPLFTWIADSDPRIVPAMVVASGSDSVYAVRNFGGRFSASLSAVDYGIKRLFTPVLLITGNTDNHAINMLQVDIAQHLAPEVNNEIITLREMLSVSIPQKPENREPPPKPLDTLKIVERYLDHQVSLATKRYKERIESGRLVVVGGIIDLANRYGKGYGRLLIININGETADHTLQGLRVLDRIEPKVKAVYVGRKASQK